LSQGDEGDATGHEVQGRRRAAAIRKSVRHHVRVRLLLPLLHAPEPALGPVAGVAVPVRGMCVGAEGRRFPTAVVVAPGRGTVDRVRGNGRAPWVGCPRGAGEGGGQLATGAREDKEPGSGTPMMVTTTGRSVCSFLRSQGRVAGAMVQDVGRQEAPSGRVWPASCWRSRVGRQGAR